MSIPINEKITARREELGLTDTFVAEKVGLSIDAYWDIEAHEDEIKELVDFVNVKKLCDVLKFDFFELFGLRCAFCEQGEEYLEEYKLPRNKLLRKRRIDKGITIKDFSEKTNISEEYYDRFEEEPNILETRRIELLIDISNVTNIPLQILANIKCKKCGR